MAASSLLALIDDIATILDDVALLTKVATKKTAGVLGDDLALNAQQVAGVRAEQELPVVWAVAKGSFRNKAILVPAALAISTVAPWAITPLLMAGGAFLCYEGFEKLAHRFLPGHAEDNAHRAELLQAMTDQTVDLVALEQEKIKGAVRTDFILSAEIIVIALGTVAEAAFITRVSVLTGIAVIMTIGVYGLVGGIVKLDDAGLYLTQRTGSGPWARSQQRLGGALLGAAPWLMRGLSVAGTAAMFLVGGSILTHGIPALHHEIEDVARGLGALPGVGRPLAMLVSPLLNIGAGVLAGALALAGIGGARRLFDQTRGCKH